MTHQTIIGFLLLWLIALPAPAQTNRALMIAIDSYPQGNGWLKMHGTNDTTIIIPLLLRHGYRRNNIRTLINHQATKQAIVHELRKLVAHSDPGDYIYIHFSCHGQQMTDDNGDEPDGKDEALIPYDAPRWYAKNAYEGKYHLRDDEFEVLLNNIRRKVRATGNVTVVLDACHSGTADRDTDDDTYIRGTAFVFGPQDPLPPGNKPRKAMPPIKTGKNMSPITIFSACQPDQENHEYRDAQGTYYGLLSYALAEVSDSLNAGLSTIDLFRKLTLQMQTMSKDKKQKQAPYFESTQQDETFKIAR